MVKSLSTEKRFLKIAFFSLLAAFGCTSKTASELSEIELEHAGIKVELDLEVPDKGFQIEVLNGEPKSHCQRDQQQQRRQQVRKPKYGLCTAQ